MSDYLKLAQDVVARARRLGDVEVEAYITDSIETQIRVDGGQVEQLSQSGEKGLGVRVIARDVAGGRTGYAYTSDFSDAALDATVQAAVELAQVATPDPYRALPPLQAVPEEDLDIFDPALADVSTEQKVALAKQAEQFTRDADARVFHTQSNYGDFIAHVYLANSNGFAGSYSRTAAYTYVMASARDDASGDQAMGFGLAFSVSFDEVNPQQVGQQAAYRATLTLGAGSIPTQTMSVVFDPLIMAELLAYISFALNAQSMQRGRSFLMGRMGQEVASDKVTLLDSGRLKRGLASAPFDGEGVPTSATRLINEGTLQGVIYDTYTARQAGVQSTGNAQRGSHRALPALGASNFYMQPGDKSHEEIIAGVEKGLYVTRIMQTGGINPITGDCSMAASGQLIENGRLTQPVNGVTVATTLTDLLKNVVEVGSNLITVPFAGAISVPTVRVDNMTVGGE